MALFFRTFLVGTWKVVCFHFIFLCVWQLCVFYRCSCECVYTGTMCMSVLMWKGSKFRSFSVALQFTYRVRVIRTGIWHSSWPGNPTCFKWYTRWTEELVHSAGLKKSVLGFMLIFHTHWPFYLVLIHPTITCLPLPLLCFHGSCIAIFSCFPIPLICSSLMEPFLVEWFIMSKCAWKYTIITHKQFKYRFCSWHKLCSICLSS